MPPLPSDLRRVLENAVIAARAQATTAAGGALKRLAVAAKEFPPYLTPDERALRLKLRAAAKQLGDPWSVDRQAFGTLTRLTHEVAYEHWHRMLFARFLAENNLLVHPEHNVPVDLPTVAELAQEEAAKTNTKADTWSLAGRFAAGMLPQIFRPDDPALAVQLAPEHQQALERILESLPPSVFTADDSLGWVYQFWQSAEKDRVNAGVKGGDKITGETLPAVTQLFTEHYMVLFLLHNTVGAWHATKRMSKLTKAQWARIETEADARAAVALPEYSFDYLRFVKDEESGQWRPAAGAFHGWPKTAKELNVLDPCCGSGHFLVAALELLTRLRIADEGLDPRVAAAAVIEQNLFGLELDARCTQIAAFNVAFAAWKLAGDHFAIPELHIACSGLGPSATLEHWVKLAGDDDRLKAGMTRLHRAFQRAPELGSLIDMRGGLGDLPSEVFSDVQPLLARALASETTRKDDDARERAVAAQGMAKAAEILSGDYTLIITNVPYLGRGGQGDIIKAFCEKEYPEAKADLATVFVSRILRWLAKDGTTAVVTPQNWLFLTSYKKLRERLLKERTWNMVARLGPGAFETIGGHVVNVALITISGGKPAKTAIMAGIDASAAKSPAEKAALLRGDAVVTSANATARDDPRARDVAGVDEGLEDEASAEPVPEAGPADGSIKLVPQAEQLKNPDARVTLIMLDRGSRISAIAATTEGLSTGDLSQLVRQFWEVPEFGEGWVGFQGGIDAPVDFGGRDRIINWAEDARVLKTMPGARFIGVSAWGKEGVLIRQMGTLPATRYLGDRFDDTTAVIVPNASHHVGAVWAFCNSPAFVNETRKLDQKLSVTSATFAKIPFDLAHWQKVATEKYPSGLPEPQSGDPTQWLFHGHPAGRGPLTTDPSAHRATVLQVAIARLVGYRWPAELDPKMRLAPEARAWVDKCKGLERFADDDGVVPLVPINKEQPGAERVRSMLEAAFGNQWSPGLLNDLLAAAGSPGKSLDEWVKHEFFAQHCALFQQRPFVWQIWDGKKDGFNILVHYHRLAEGEGKGKKLLEKIVYTYLGDWITQQQAAAKQGVAGADLRLKAAQDLQKKLEAIVAGEPPYDIFVRWKPLHEQPIGWNPDINDGVRVNIRPFVTAGVLRGKVNVKWTKDRGKEPESIRPKRDFPWFWSCPEAEPPTDFAGGAKFTGERLNDLHYTNKAKNEARASTRSKGAAVTPKGNA